MTNHECPCCNTSGGKRDGQNNNYEAYYKCVSAKCGQGWAEAVICPTCFKKYNYEDFCAEPWAHARIAERHYLFTENDTYETEFKKRILHSSKKDEKRFDHLRETKHD